MKAMNNKQDMYNWIKITGFAAFIPFVLISGPIGGYLIGLFLIDKMHLPRYTMYISLGVCSIASFIQTVKVIKAMIKLDKKD